MSERSISITATFSDSEIAQEVETILKDLSLSDGIPLHEYLQSKELTKGITFTYSWWISEQIKRDSNELHLKVTGSSLSGDRGIIHIGEEDIFEWLTLFGVKQFKTEETISMK